MSKNIMFSQNYGTLNPEYVIHENTTENLLVYTTNAGNQIVKINSEYENLSNDLKLKVIKELNEWCHNEAIKILNQNK